MPETWVEDRTAINYLERCIIDLGWMWREQPILDKGIDGVIEICDDSKPTGKLLAVQSKGGESYFYRKKNGELNIKLQTKHLRYWADYALPVLVIGYLSTEKIAYWIYSQQYIKQNQKALSLKQKTIRVTVPKENVLGSDSKEALSLIPDNFLKSLIDTIRNEEIDPIAINERLSLIAKESEIDVQQFHERVLNWCINIGGPLYKSLALLREKKAEEAESCLQYLVRNTEIELANQYAWLAASLTEQEKNTEAEKVIDNALNLHSLDEYALNIKGILLGKKKKYEEACTYFKNAVRINPKFTSPQYNLGKALLDQNKYSEALQHISNAVELKPAHADGHRLKGDSLKHLKEYSQAISSYNEALHLNNKNADAWKGLGDIFGYQGKFEKSIDAYTKAIEIDPKYIVALSNRGFAKYHKGDLNGARNDFEQVLRIDPKNEHALKGMKRLNKLE